FKGKCPCGSANIVPEMDIMDTWMTSSCTPQINANWGAKDERKNFLPMSLRPQAHDIIRTWAFYTLVKSYYHYGGIPWKDIMMSGHGLDSHGQKMSKSKGNFIVAQDVIKNYSADAFRFWAASVKLGDDLPYQEKDLQTGQKTVTKLFNASKFVLMHLQDFDAGSKPNLLLIDRWLLSKFSRIVDSCTQSFEKYEYSKAKADVENFFWNIFCDYYLEMAKDRLYNPEIHGKQARESAQYALYHVLNGIIKLFAPIIPHITEEIYQSYFAEKEGKKSIHVSGWPAFDERLLDEQAEKAGDICTAAIAAVRKFKAAEKLSMKAELAEIIIECNPESEKIIEEIKQDILSTTKAAGLSFGKAEDEIGLGIRITIKK
ncbi:MAG: class I tRNA ligase family protein, partial [Candidatus Woesearchaeota archaeon]